MFVAVDGLREVFNRILSEERARRRDCPGGGEQWLVFLKKWLLSARKWLDAFALGYTLSADVPGKNLQQERFFMQFTEEMVSLNGALVLVGGPKMENIELQANLGSAIPDSWGLDLPWNSEETLAMSRLSVLCARDPDEEDEEEEDLDYFSDDEEDDDDLDDEDDLDDDFEEDDDEEDEADDDDF